MQVTETFRVREVDGAQEYLVIGARTDVHPSPLNGRTPLPGPIHYRLADGSSPLKEIDKNTFEIVRTGKRVRRIS